MKSAAFFDIDNTLVDGYTQKIFAQYLFCRGCLPLKPIIKIFFWNYLYKFKITNDISKIQDTSIQILKGWEENKLLQLAKECFNMQIVPKIFKEAQILIEDHIKNHREIILVSSSIDALIISIKNYFRADIALGTKLEKKDGIYTGRIVGSRIYGEDKAAVILELAQKRGLDLMESYAYSDHISDLPMLKIVGNPIAINPDHQLKKTCEQKNWKMLFFTRGDRE